VVTSRAKLSLARRKKLHELASVDGKWVLTDNTRPVVVAEGNDSVLVSDMKMRKGFAPKVYTIRPGGDLQTTTLYGSPRARLSYSPGAITLNRRFNSETNISHLSSKLIMINGKEATERDLKKLSAADIESMSVKSGDEVIKQYGDKAKDGVLFIETKKEK